LSSFWLEIIARYTLKDVDRTSLKSSIAVEDSTFILKNSDAFREFDRGVVIQLDKQEIMPIARG
jgi:hypothetical protein